MDNNKKTYSTPYGDMQIGYILTINGVQYIFKGKREDKFLFEVAKQEINTELPKPFKHTI